MIRSTDLASSRPHYAVNSINIPQASRPAGPCPQCGKGQMTVVEGFCSPEMVHAEWMRCKTMVEMRDAHGPRHIAGQYHHFASGAHVATARCRIVKDFLAHPGKPEWLWMQDTDATYGDLVLERLLACADPIKAPIVGALSFGVTPRKVEGIEQPANEVGALELELFPTLYRLRADGQMLRMLDYERDAMVPVDATGCHCLLIHRSVLEDERWDTSHPLPWFRMGSLLRGEEVSEDMFFCLNARKMGYPIYVNTSAKTGHIKPFIADEELYLRQLKERTVPMSADEDAYRPAAPLVVVVPSRARPAQAAELVEAWRATTEGKSELLFCLDEDDETLPEYPPAGGGVHVLVGPRAQLVEWTNRVGVPLAPYCRGIVSWGDDHRPRTAWESATLHAFDEGAHFVYGDDLLQGENLPTACAVSSVAIGALGYVAPPALRHLYCDNFWLRLGRETGTLRYLPDVVVEHMHPAAGKAEMDASYADSNSPESYSRDGRVFAEWVATRMGHDVEALAGLTVGA